VVGTWIVKRKGNYSMDVTVEKLDTTVYPLMKGLSSLSPYLTAYHSGIVFARPEFAFAATDNVTVDGETCPGIASPVKNPKLVVAANEHVMKIHDELNGLLAKIANMSSGDLKSLRDHYAENPIYIAIMADTTMVPHYYYYNPDSDFVSGEGAASDFMYGDIDPDLQDTENDTYTYYPFQENAVGRVTGYDSEDCSALIARTIYYDKIIQLLGDWKDNATVQTGTGIEFQKIPIITSLMNRLKSVTGFGPVRDEPTKFWTGESKFINGKLCNDTEKGGFNVKSAYRLEAQRTGLLGDVISKGGQYQLESNYIFTFAPGYYGDENFSEIMLVGKDMILPIYVTRWQAESIMSGVEGENPGRPMTHDVFIKVINAMGGSIKKVVIDELHGGVFMAKLYIERYRDKKAEEIVMDARPSDCIALAAREGCDIYVSEEVLLEAGRSKEDAGI